MPYWSTRCVSLPAYVCSRREVQCCVWHEGSGQASCGLSLLCRVVLGCLLSDYTGWGKSPLIPVGSRLWFRVEVTVNVEYLTVTVSGGSEPLGHATVVRYATCSVSCMDLRHFKHIAAPFWLSCTASLRHLVLALYVRRKWLAQEAPSRTFT
jgi:hypothetical protein